MANTQQAGRGNAERRLLSATSLPFLALPNEATLHETHAHGANDPIESGSSSEDNDSESFSSNRAQIGEMEADEDTNDDPTEQELDSPTTRAQRRDEIIPKHAMELYEAEFMNQVCYCAYHWGDFDEEEVVIQDEEASTVIKPSDAEYAYDAHTASSRPIQSNLLPPQDCCYHGTLAGDTNSDERSSGRKCEGV